MKKQVRQGHMEGVLVLLLFAVFAGSLLLVLLTGAKSYRQVAQRGADSYDRRVCVQYIAAKVRHGDTAGNIFVGGFSDPAVDDGISTLYLRQVIEDVPYDVRIYCYDGAVRELFAPAGEAFQPQDGDAVLPAEGLTFTQTNGLLSIEAEGGDGETSSLLLSLRSGEEAAA